MTKPSGSIRWSGVPVATHRRPIEPVFGGISGATSTTCTVGSARLGGELDPVRPGAQHARAVARALRVAHQLVPGRTQQPGLDPALHAAVGHVLGAQPERPQIERLARLVVQHDLEAAHRIAVDPDDDPRRVLDLDLGAVLAQLEAGPAVVADGHGARVEPANGRVRDLLAVAVPTPILAEPDAPGVDGREAGARHHPARSSSVSRMMVTGPSLTRLSAMRAWNRPVSTGTRLARTAVTKCSYSACAAAAGAAAVNAGRRPRRQSAWSVNCDTTSSAPPTSSSARFICPASSSKTRSPTTLRPSSSASACESPAATPSSTQSPGPIAPTSWSLTVTRASRTRCTTARTARG